MNTQEYRELLLSVNGIGNATADALIELYPTVEDLKKCLSEVKLPSKYEKVKNGLESVVMQNDAIIISSDSDTVDEDVIVVPSEYVNEEVDVQTNPIQTTDESSGTILVYNYTKQRINIPFVNNEGKTRELMIPGLSNVRVASSIVNSPYYQDLRRNGIVGTIKRI